MSDSTAAAPAPARRNIAQLEAGERLDDELFLLLQKDLRTSNNGSLYIHAVLADATGQMLARLWNASNELFASMPLNGLVRVRGRVESYKGKPQFIIDGLREVEPGAADPSDFLPKSRHDNEAMWLRLKDILRGIEQRDLLALIAKFVNDEAFAKRFRRAPAARANHHAFIGGLLEHTLALLELAEVVLPRYPRVNRDLVLAGIFFHDIGKTAELNSAANFDYTSEGQLLGHIVIAALWVQERARQLEQERGAAFPPRILMALNHLIVAHHGKYEFGSPRLPATPEAFMVHYLDNLDAKLNMVFNAIDADDVETRDWTDWVPALENRIFKPDVLRDVGRS